MHWSNWSLRSQKNKRWKQNWLKWNNIRYFIHCNAILWPHFITLHTHIIVPAGYFFSSFASSSTSSYSVLLSKKSQRNNVSVFEIYVYFFDKSYIWLFSIWNMCVAYVFGCVWSHTEAHPNATHLPWKWISFHQEKSERTQNRFFFLGLLMSFTPLYSEWLAFSRGHQRTVEKKKRSRESNKNRTYTEPVNKESECIDSNKTQVHNETENEEIMHVSNENESTKWKTMHIAF